MYKFCLSKDIAQGLYFQIRVWEQGSFEYNLHAEGAGKLNYWKLILVLIYTLYTKGKEEKNPCLQRAHDSDTHPWST